VISAMCKGCGARVYAAINDRDDSSERFYSEVLVYRLMMHNGGTPRAVRVHGVYQVHKCGRGDGYLRSVERVKQSQKGVIPAAQVRARRRRKIPVSSGRGG